MSTTSGPRIPPELAMQVKQKIESLMEHATTAATQGKTAVEEMIMSGGHSGDAAIISGQKAVEINTDLMRIINGCQELANKLGIAVHQFVDHDQDAKNRVASIPTT